MNIKGQTNLQKYFDLIIITKPDFITHAKHILILNI